MKHLSQVDLQHLVTLLNKLKAESKLARKNNKASMEIRFAEEAAEVVLATFTGRAHDFIYEIFDLVGLIEVFARQGLIDPSTLDSVYEAWSAKRIEKDQVADVRHTLSLLSSFKDALSSTSKPDVTSSSVDVESDPTFNSELR